MDTFRIRSVLISVLYRCLNEIGGRGRTGCLGVVFSARKPRERSTAELRAVKL